MTRNPVNTQELELALDGLSDDVTDPQITAPGPPPLTAKARAAASKLPTEIEKLFILDSAGSVMPRGGPDEKVEFFRQRVKMLEERFGQIKEAWSAQAQKKEGLDGSGDKMRSELAAKLEERENEAAEARVRATEAAEKLTALQGFLNQKKEEFEAYGKSVAEAFTEKEQERKKTLAELTEALEKRDALRDEVKSLKRVEKDLRQEMDGRTEALKQQISRAERSAKKKVKAVEQEIGRDKSAVEAAQQRALAEREALVRAEFTIAENELNEQIEILRDKLREAKSSVQDGLSEAEQRNHELREQLEARNEAIEKLEATVAKAKKSLARKEAEIADAKDSAGASAFDPDKAAKLQRAIQYASKVLNAAHKDQIAEDQQAEIFKRACRAIQTAEDLAAEL